MKKAFSVLLAAGLAAALSVPAGAQEAEPTTIPETVQIEDPLNDANGLNDQGNRGDTGFQGDHAGPADAGSVSDILKVWFSNDAETVSVHFQTEVPAPASSSTLFQVYSNGGGDYPLGCLRWAILVPGEYQGQTTTYQGAPKAKLIDRCNDGSNFWDNGIDGEILIETLADETGILTATFPRAYSPLLAEGLSIVKPFAETKSAAGAEAASAFATPLTIDNTVEGSDYALTIEEAEPTKPPIKKGCSKGSPKAKKKGCKK